MMSSPVKATSLAAIYRAFEPSPLVRRDEFEAFYVRDLDRARGGKTIDRFRLELQKAHGGAPYKALLMGHRGTGKSTELTRLIQELSGTHVCVRIVNELDPASFKPFDVLTAILLNVVELAAKDPVKGGIGYRLPETDSRAIYEWLSAKTTTTAHETSKEGAVEGKVGLSPDSWWSKLWGLSAEIRGEMKYAADRKEEIVEYRLQRLSVLIGLVNRAIAKVREAALTHGKDLLVVIEEFDRSGVNPKLVEEFLITYANVFDALQINLIATIPVSLGYSEQRTRLPIEPKMLYDLPVFEENGEPHAAGRAALTKLLYERISPDLIEAGQAERMIIASGGNVRDLFGLVRDAGATAELREAKSIEKQDVDAAVSMLKRTVKARLGQSDDDRITYRERMDKLKAILQRGPSSKVLDPVLLSLLRSLSVQEFNGDGRYAVAPMVEELMRELNEI